MNRYTVAFAEKAEEALLDIVAYIALDNPVRAESFVQELTASLRQTLSIFPKSGKVVQDLVDLGQEIRMWSHGNYNSYYRVDDDKRLVEVLFILHGSRDIHSSIIGL